jgi:error-prone DNA polymerase
MPAWIELHAHSYFSLLDASSSPEALVAQAQALAMPALALTDHDTLAGAVRFWSAARNAGIKPLIGAELTLAATPDGPLHHLTVLAESQTGYANLCALISGSRRRLNDDGSPEHVGKIPPRIPAALLAEHTAGLIALSGCRKGLIAAPLAQGAHDAALDGARLLTDLFGRERLFVELQDRGAPGDQRVLRGLIGIARALGLPTVLTGNTHYATRDFARLRDCMLAIDANLPLTDARKAGLLPINHNAALPSPDVMAHRFAELPDALSASLAIAERCWVDLDFGEQRLPRVETPAGATPFSHLYELCHAALPRRYPALAPRVLKQLAHELDVIERAGLAPFFLIVADIVRFARERGIRCSGRGSAAGSIVSYLLGISHVCPFEHQLLFERFLSDDKRTMPDIDLDFDSFRREEVIQYVYHKYGHAHVAMVANHVTFQARSAIRDLGKALAFPEAVIERLIKQVDAHEPAAAADQLEALDADPDADAGIALGGVLLDAQRPVHALARLVRQIDGAVRHLGIHSGGMIITGPPLSHVVPTQPATMPGRYVIEWDKDSAEDAGLIKIDVLALRTLGLIDKALTLINQRADAPGLPPDFDALTFDDDSIYDMLAAGDTIGTFQVESRAQIQMLPRVKPRSIRDIAVQIAIIRPGPIQGGAVHPYLKRRIGEEAICYDHPALEPILRDTYGVLLFQEDCLRVAMTLAGFSAGDADQLRRAMSRSRSKEAMAEMRERFLRGAAGQGVDAAVAEAVFGKLAGFAQYGFCRSHAASFALISWQTLWLKRYHPAAFYAALLNSQPMGFYTPEVIVGDMKRHGIALLPPDVNHSAWDYSVVHDKALRMGASTVAGLGEANWARVEDARAAGAFASLSDFCRRTQLSRTIVTELIRAGLFDAFGERRRLLWELGEVDYETRGLALEPNINAVALPLLGDLERTLWDYEQTGLSVSGHVMRHFRPALIRAGALTTAQVKACKNGAHVRLAGLQVVRQMPGTAKGVVFVSCEDEHGLVDVVLQPRTWQKFRILMKTHSLLLFQGVVQQVSGAVSVLALGVQPLTAPPDARQINGGDGGAYAAWH